MNPVKLSLTFITVFLLAACGGSDNSSNDTPEPVARTPAVAPTQVPTSSPTVSTPVTPPTTPVGQQASVFTVTAKSNGFGQVLPSTLSITDGQSAQLLLQAEQDFFVKSASGCNGTVVGDNLYFIPNVTANCSVEVVFEEMEVDVQLVPDEPDDITITAMASEYGQILPSNMTMSAGESAQFIIQADENYVAKTVIGCGGTLVSDTQYFVPSALENCSVFAVFEAIKTVEDTEAPVVVGASSPDNDQVIVQFSEPMAADLITSVSNFNITNTETNTRLLVTDVSFVDDRNQAVLLHTLAQNSVPYIVRVVNAYDLAGNALSGPLPEVEQDLSSAEFVGTRPDGADLVDSDNDGLPDYVELQGWPVTIHRTNGSVTNLYVSSDPFNADTDNDGVPDFDELHGGLNPTNPDTDGDVLDDNAEWNVIYSDGTKQDTDGDGIQDGFEYLFFRTSPILADTDGDQLGDAAEVSAANRNPLIADLPSPSIRVGNVNLQLDTRLTYTDEVGNVVTEAKTSEATLTQGENDTYTSANETSTKNTISNSTELTTSVSAEYETGADGGAKFGFSVSRTARTEQGSERGSTVSFGEESSIASEEAFHDSLTTENARDTRESVVREIVGASMRVDLIVENVGSIPFTISNLELTAQTQDPLNRGNILPVASLVPANNALDDINIGTLGDSVRGPFVFETTSIFPNEMEELLKSPRGIIVQLANFDITDELGNNFAFTSQAVLERTASITFDLGDGRAENYRVATASEHDSSSGLPSGISMARALEIIGLQRYQTIRDGGNGIAETMVMDGSDDIATQDFGSAIEPRTVIIQAGEDGFLQSVTPMGDDHIVESDYETAVFATSALIIDGGNGLAESTAIGDDTQSVPDGIALDAGGVVVRSGSDNVIETEPGGDDVLIAQGQEHRILVRFRDVEADSASIRFWTLFTNNTNIQNVDLDNFRVRAGEQYDFAFVQDNDEDGVFAREEYLHTSSDFSENTDGCSIDDPNRQCDNLSDFTEIREGWQVRLKTANQSYQVFSNPSQADSDRDGIVDHIERACGLDPRLRDSDLDGLSDYEELFGIRVVEGNETLMVSIDVDDSAATSIPITRYLGAEPSVIPPERAAGAVWVEHRLEDACIEALEEISTNGEGFATDPLNADTDGDFINDLAELDLGLHPSDRADGADFLDDDGDGLVNSLEVGLGWEVTVNGSTSYRVFSEPTDADSDNDKLPDLLEYFLKSDPNNPDTDGDGLSDSDEYRNGGALCVGSPNVPCTTFSNLNNGDYNEFVNACNVAIFCNISVIEGTGPNGLGTERQLGTNINHRDTDGDGLTDPYEIAGRDIIVNSVRISNITSDPKQRDTDGDGLNDSQENSLGANPRSGDTDGDSRSDAFENSVSFTSLTQSDIRINMQMTGATLNVNAPARFAWYIGPQFSGDRTCRTDINGISVGDLVYDTPIPGVPCNLGSFVINQGSSLAIYKKLVVTQNGGGTRECDRTITLNYNTDEGNLISPNCSIQGGTFDAFQADIRFSIDRIE